MLNASNLDLNATTIPILAKVSPISVLQRIFWKRKLSLDDSPFEVLIVVISSRCSQLQSFFQQAAGQLCIGTYLLYFNCSGRVGKKRPLGIEHIFFEHFEYFLDIGVSGKCHELFKLSERCSCSSSREGMTTHFTVLRHSFPIIY